MRARITTLAALLSTFCLVTPAIADDCLVVGEILQRCQSGSEPPPPPPPPPPEPQPAPQPAPEPAPAPEPQPDPGPRPAAVARILVLMNGERAAHGLPAFVLRDDISALSAPHSQAMAEKGDIWHNDGYFTPAVKQRLDARLLGENVARNTDVDDAHRRLMNSPGHRANILDARFAFVGLAVYDDGWDNLYVTQSFVQPLPAAAPKPAAATERPRSVPSTTTPPSAPPTTAASASAPEPAPAEVLAAAPEQDIAPVDSTRTPPRGPNMAFLALLALLLSGSMAALWAHQTGHLAVLRRAVALHHLPLWTHSFRRIDR